MNSVFKVSAGILGVLLLALVCYVVWNEIAEDEIYLLPDGYSGVVTVILNRDDGEEPQYQFGKRVYNIPSNGVLITQFDLNAGWHSPTEFFFRTGDRLVEIPYP